MKTIIHEQSGERIAEVISDIIIVRTPQDALDLLMSLSYEQNTSKVILHQANIAPEFFDLKTGLAGEIIQKATNYQMQLAIVGDFQSTESQSLRALIAETKRGRTIYFAASLEAAKQFLFQND